MDKIENIEIRNKKNYSGAGILIDRTTILGNPYSHKTSSLAKYRVPTREDAVEKYLDYARRMWVEDPKYKIALLSLAEKYKRDGKLTLICWCAPKKCHGEVLAYIIDKLSRR